MRGDRVGPFELVEVIGRGGAAQVWRARHVASAADVAIKVLPVTGDRSDALRAAVLREARAVARLDHPAIVPMLDLGDTDDRSALWLAMPLARLSLASARHLPGWEAVAELLDRLLEGLAHAHARGVVHRDLKPSNVLALGDGPPQRTAALSDFGVAVLAGDDGAARVAGTPRYMAPEQFRGSVARIGPWTDLYALGCLAWELLTGGTPFRDRDPSVLAQRHLRDAPPAFVPRLAAPAGTERWLRRLLAKDPQDRFRVAADARRALADLGAPVAWVAAAPGAAEPDDPSSSTISLDTLDLPDLLPATFDSGPASDRPPVPGPWRAEPPPEVPAALLGVGLRLLPLREPPFVGREAERSALVAALRGVAVDRRLAVRRIEGVTGVGKSRLARWLVEWAQEHGHAHAWIVRHGSGAGPDEGVDALLRSFDLSRDGAAAERAERLRWHLATATRDRPGILLLDDVHLGAESADLVSHLLACDSLEPLPLLVLATVQTDDARDHAAAEAALAGWLRHPAAQVVPLGPMAAEDTALLARALRMRPGEDALALERVVGGVPLLAVRVVAHAHASGTLVAGPDGFEFGAGAVLPTDLRSAFEARVDAALTGQPEPAVRAAGLAAVLGDSAHRDEWTAVCAALAAHPDPTALEALVRAGLAEETAAGWRFAHVLARVAVERRLPDRPAAHAAAARVVPAEAPWRGARHLEEAGQTLPALDALLVAAERLAFLGRLAEAEGALRRFADLAAAIHLPEPDARWGVRLARQAHVSARLGRTDRCREASEALDAARERFGWPELAAAAMSIRGGLALMWGRPDEAERLLTEALALAERDGDVSVARRTAARLAQVWVVRGRVDEGRAALERAADESEAVGERVLAAVCRAWLSKAAFTAGDAAEAIRWGERAVASGDGTGDLGALAHAWCVLGNARELAGDSPGAVEAWQHSARRYAAVGSPQEVIPRLNLGVRRWREGDPLAADAELERAETVFGRVGQHAMRIEARLRRLCWSRDPAFVAEVLHEAETTDIQLGLSTGHVIDEATEARSDPAERRRLAELAATVWRRMGREDLAAASLNRAAVG